MTRMKKFNLIAISLIILLFIFRDKAGAVVNISNSPDYSSTYPRVAVDSQGNIHAIWVEMTGQNSGDLYYSCGTRNTLHWTTPINLSMSNKVYSDSLMMTAIDVDDSDRVYVVWTEGNSIRLRVLENGTWGSSVAVGVGAGLDGPRVAVSSEGDIFVVWWSFSGQVYFRARINGAWEAEQVISDTGKRSKFPDIAVGKNRVLACWVENNGGIYQAVYRERGRSFNSSWTSIVFVAPSNLSQQHAVAEIDLEDTAHIIWTTVISEDGTRVVEYAYSKNATFSSAQAISPSAVLHYPSIAERRNNLYTCWQVGGYGSGISIDYNIKVFGSWLGKASIKNSDSSTFCDVAVSRNEDIIYFAWDAKGDIYLESCAGPGVYLTTAHFDGHDFNGDGTSDIGVFRPSNGYWYIKDIALAQWGAASDIPVSGDYDGNGKTDIAVWRYSNGMWYIKDKGAFQWGTAGDIPVPGKYNSDSLTELAVWRATNGIWYIKDIGAVPWGTLGDIPVPADYDGDGITDIAVWRPSEGMWYIRNIGSFQYGTIGDIPVPADYNGDGKADIAVWRPSNGFWYIKNVGIFEWGTDGDIPVPGKYDQDNKVDIAVWRPSSGLWYIKNIGVYQWGTAGDLPLVR